MDSFIFAIVAAEEDSARQKQKQKMQRKILRDRSNPFDLDEKLFIRNWRLNKAAFKYVLEELEQELIPSSINPICRLAAVLRFLAGGAYQLSVGNDFGVGMAQSTFSCTLKSVINILESRLCPLWIQIDMQEHEKSQAKRDFYSKAGFPGVVMCVDGTHINIIAPVEEKSLYYNRKGNFSINAMLICDNHMKIRCVDARYPGSNHDSHIWNLSGSQEYFRTKYLAGERNTWILGDAGYPLEPWLMTPFRSAEAGSPKSTYNIKHSKTRNIVERTIGVLKNRFRCILGARQLHYSPRKASQIINVVCALHNICIHYRVEDYMNVDLPEIIDEEVSGALETDPNNHRSAANAIRENILNTFV